MGLLTGTVVVVTGAGSGIGREHALLCASEGAKVVVNDVGREADGSLKAQAVVSQIQAAGGEATANHDDVADWDGGKSLIDTAVNTFGQLDILINNAGILRDQVVTRMTEQEWDLVVKVDLKGHFVPTRWAADHWRERSKAGEPVRAALVHTSSSSGLFGTPGQANYVAAKAGVAMFSKVCASELARYGVRSNTIVPAARTPLTDGVPAVRALMAAPTTADEFDVYDPANVAPLAVALSAPACELTGEVFYIRGGLVTRVAPWAFEHEVQSNGRWDPSDLINVLHGLAGATFGAGSS